MKSTFLKVICCCFLLISCNDFDSGVQHRVFGLVTDQNNQPLSNTEVEAFSNNGFVVHRSDNPRINSFFTNNEGRFEAFLPGIIRAANSYRMVFSRSISENLAPVTFHIIEQDFQNKTLQIPQIRLFPANDLVNVTMMFQFAANVVTIEKIEWLGDATMLGSFISNDNFFLNRVKSDGTFTLRYTIRNINTNQVQTFELTRTLSGSNYEEFISI